MSTQEKTMKKPSGWIAYNTLSSFTLYRLLNVYKAEGEDLMYHHIKTILQDRNYID